MPSPTNENGETEVRVISATGVLGSGFRTESIERGMSMNPHFIGCDAGSTDPGPFYLGSGKTAFSYHSVKSDMHALITATREAGIPLLIGSCGTAGGRPHLAVMRQIVTEIAKEEELSFKLAIIQAEQEKEYLLERLGAGAVTPLGDLELTAETIQRSERIVGMMGEEPYLKALDEGADVVIAGRSSDCAIFAGLPVRLGVDPGIAWHAAKILECGGAAAVSRPAPDSMYAVLRSDHFEMEPLGLDMRCSAQSVAAHSLYETADPYKLIESSGTLDLTEAKYEEISDRRVRVSGGKYLPAARYTVKLEGAELAGYQSVVIGGIRDPFIIRQIDDWQARLKERVDTRVQKVYGRDADGYVFNIRVFGRDAVMGPLEPVKEITSHEVGLVMEVTAASQEIATGIVSLARHQALHLPIPEWRGFITGVACLYSPAYLERGAVYRFNCNSVVEPRDPYEMFPIEYVDIG